ncbi:MAG: ribonuclease T [Piscirickettsiaceae bacterium]|nr:MAG: ribonuclease T [Piscirickettsiaceae bacterium]PCI69497.1 MAG: ribonuclease T [Piscirickettsiaceae bacterium]
MTEPTENNMANRFRGYLPVVVDLETAGFNSATDALLEMAVVILAMDETGKLAIQSSHREHVVPFEGANLEPAALKFNGIDPYHPFRLAIDEKDALTNLFKPVRQAVKDQGCSRAILVGHNPAFDIGFMNAAVERTKFKRNPFHPFSTFDTATLGGLAYKQTVLARVAQAAGIAWDSEQAHSALYDAEQTALLFCKIVNQWDAFSA